MTTWNAAPMPELGLELVRDVDRERFRSRLPRWDPRLWGDAQFSKNTRPGNRLLKLGLAWGRERVKARKLQQENVTPTGDVAPVSRFTGKEEDVEVGLQYFGKRYLSPYLGRWISADPLAVHAPGKADLNLYAYVHGAVLKAIDPLGLEDIVYSQSQDKATGAQVTNSVDEELTDSETVEFPVDKLTVAPKGGKAAAPMESAAPSPAARPPAREDGDTGASKDERFDAAESALWNLGIEKMQKAIGDNGGFVMGVVGKLTLDKLKADEPPEKPSNFRDWQLRQSYDFAHDGASKLHTALGAVGAGALGELAETASAPAVNNGPMVLVTRWGRPGLQPNDWVMKGGPSDINYALSFKWQPGLGNEYAPPTQGEMFLVPRTDLVKPSGLSPINGALKSWYGQWKYEPGGP